MLISYATLQQVKNQYEKNNDAAVTNSIMADYARKASAVVGMITHQVFSPYLEVHYFDAGFDRWGNPNGDIDSHQRTLVLDARISELLVATLADDTSLVIDTDVRIWPRNRTPGIKLQLMFNTTSNWTDYVDDWQQGIVIDGAWCWRERYAQEAWQLSGDTTELELDASETSIQVDDADGFNWLHETPRLDIGQMIRIDDEYMAVTFVDATNNPNTITVIRGVRGSTKATHDAATAIEVFVPEPEITRATVLMAAFNYARRGVTDRASFDGLKVVAGMEIPDEVSIILEHFTEITTGRA